MFGPLIWQRWRAAHPRPGRRRGAGTTVRGQRGRRRPPAAAAMTREEAYQVLGLKPGASEADIRAAHHRLMRTAHPDTGGSDWLAARINLARDVLLGRHRDRWPARMRLAADTAVQRESCSQRVAMCRRGALGRHNSARCA